MKKVEANEDEIRERVRYTEEAINWVKERNVMIEDNIERIKYLDKLIDITTRSIALSKEQNEMLISAAQIYVKDIRSGKYGECYKNIKLPELIKGGLK